MRKTNAMKPRVPLRDNTAERRVYAAEAEKRTRAFGEGDSSLRAPLTVSGASTASRCESGNKLHAHTLTRGSSAPEPREAYGVRPACPRFSCERKVVDSSNLF